MLFSKLKYSPNTVILRLASLRFFYIHVLKRSWSIAETPTALKRDKAQESWVNAAPQTMASLNRPAADVLRQLDGVGEGESQLHAATDVTGFGLVGHAKEMASGSGVSLRIDHQQIEYLPGAVEAANSSPAGLKNNREFAQDHVRFAPSHQKQRAARWRRSGSAVSRRASSGRSFPSSQRSLRLSNGAVQDASSPLSFARQRQQLRARCR